LVKDTGSPPFIVDGIVNIESESAAVKAGNGRESGQAEAVNCAEGHAAGRLRPPARRVR